LNRPMTDLATNVLYYGPS